MTDYIAIAIQGILPGFSTGMGIIFAHELWSIITDYRKKAKEMIKNNIYIETKK